jgi:hypothetical protein
MIDTLLQSILLVTTIGGDLDPTNLYITDRYLLSESKHVIDGGPHVWLYDVEHSIIYTLKEGNVTSVVVEPKEWGQERGWKAEGFDSIAREKVADTTFQGCDCVLLQETVRGPDVFKPDQRDVSYRYKVMCWIPEVESLPLQTRLAIPSYREWENEEYPLMVKDWLEGAEAFPVMDTQLFRQQPFPVDKVREWFGIEIQP